MDINDMRIGITVVSLLLFLVLMVWTWARGRRGDFEEAAQLPFLENDHE